MDRTWVFLNKELFIQPRFEILFELSSVIDPLFEISSCKKGEEEGRTLFS